MRYFHLTYFAPIFLCLLLNSCNTSKVSESGYAEKALVTRFVNLWVKSFHDERIEAFIAPSYLKANKLSFDTHKVNNFAPVDYTIEFYNKGIVTVRIWGEKHRWEHRLLFDVVKYKGKLYLYPSKHTDKFITPWQSVAYNINGR